jgi:hypothetical protein
MTSPDAGDVGAARPGPSWHADPLVRVPRLRWWAGDRWTAWVVASPADGPAIAWDWALADLPHPIRWGTPVLRVGAAPPLLVQPQASATVTTAPPPVDASPQGAGSPPPMPLVDAPSPTLPPPPAPASVPLDRPAASAPTAPVKTPAHRSRSRRRHLVPLAATLSLVLGGVAGAALLSPGTSRPALSNVVSYQDPAAGVSFAYPSPWRVQHRDPGQGVSFLAGAAGVPNRARAIVAVTVGSQRGPLPALSDFERTALSTFSAQDPGLRVSGGGEATLAGGPALDVVLTDPPTTVETVQGRTADLRPLVVTVTTRDPRGALTHSTVQDFLGSIGS